MYDGYYQAICALLALQIFAVAGRVYVRACLVRAFGWDDLAAVVTLLLACCYDSCLIALYTLAGGAVTLGEIAGRDIIKVINLGLATEISYIAASTALKVALGMLLLRVLVKKWMKRTIWLVMGVTVSYGIAYFFVVLYQCGSPSNFHMRIVLGQCLPRATINGTSYVHAIITALADIIYGSLPIIFLWNAEFSRRAKYSIGGILVVGSVGCVCTLVRIGWIHFLALPTATFLITSQGIATMSSVELSVGLVCLSLATYRPLVVKLMGKRSQYCCYSNDTRTGRTMSSHHGAAEELESQIPIQQRGNDTPHISSIDTTTKSWDASSPYADTASDDSCRTDHWRGGTAT